MRRPRSLLLAAVALAIALPARTEEKEFDGAEGEGGPGARARLSREVRGTMDPQQRLSAAAREYEIRRAERAAPRREALAAEASWRSLGPSSGAGRITSLAPHPTVSGTLYAGAAAGGVFRSTDGGTTWTAISDDLPNLSVGAIAVAPSAPGTLYVGTGEGSLPGAFVPGIGLVKSTDGGATWLLPTSVAATQFFRISVHPRLANVLVAGTEAGALRSTDGGATFATVTSRETYGLVTDVARDAKQPETLYAATWCPNGCTSGSAKVLKSTDDGVTWTEKSSGIAFPTGMRRENQRIALALSLTAPAVLYAATTVETEGESVSHVYRSTDGGESWIDLPGTSRSSYATIRSYMGAQGWYDNTLTVSPTSPDHVLAGGIFLARSKDGGGTFAHPPFQGATVHHDVHDLAWQGGSLYIATDGGVYRTDDFGERASERNTGLGTRQYYSVAVDPIDAGHLLAGAQDNGTDQQSSAGFRSVLSGDGFDTLFHPVDGSVAYATRQFGAVYRSLSPRAASPAFEEITPPYASAGDEAPFRTLLVMDPTNPAHLLTAGTRVWASTNGGTSWTPLSNASADGAGFGTDPVTTLAVVGNVIAAAKGGAIYRSVDGGGSWVRGTRGLPGARVNALTIDPRSTAKMWASTASPGGVYASTDGGASWAQRPDGLPAFAAQVVRLDPFDAAVAYCGTDAGIYRTLDGGASWSRFGSGLPSAPVHDIRVLADRSVVVATHGRGLWRLDGSGSGAPPRDEAPQWLVAGMAYTDGAGGTFWRSDFSVFNPHASLPMSLSLAFLDGRAGSDTNLRWNRIAVAPRETKAFTNVLAGAPFLLPRGSYGALIVRGDDVPSTPVFSGRTYNSGLASGTFGLSLPAVPISRAIAPLAATPTAVETLVGLREVPGSARTNLVLANTGPEPAAAEVVFLDEMGRPMGAKLRVDLPPWGVKQLNRVLSALPPQGAGYAGPAGTFVARISRLAGDVYPYATVIDERSSDPFLVTPPRRLAAAYRLPGIVRTPGRNGTFFVSDVVLHNPAGTARSIRLDYTYQAFRPGAPPSAVQVKSATLSMGPGETLDMTDFVRSYLAGSAELESSAIANALLDVTAEGEEPLLVSGRTYNATPAGNVGFALSGFTALDAASGGGRLVLAGLTSSAAYRTNVAYFLLGQGEARATVTAVDKTGGVIATRQITLDPNTPFLQMNDGDLFGGKERGDGVAVILDVAAGSPVGGYATVIDNVSGDAILVSAEPGTQDR